MSFGGPVGISAEEFAAKLNGREIGNEITREEEKQAEENGLIVVFGASDDLCEFVGSISDEYGIGELMFMKEGKQIESDDDYEVLEKYNALPKLNEIKAIYSKGGIHSYETIIPHVTFDIMEDGKLFCKGIVFCIEDLV